MSNFKEKTVNIIVSGGVVVDVEGLPEDWDVAITDVDDNPESWEARNMFDLDIAEMADLKEQLRKFSPPQEIEDA
tara:strand:+ start:2552 stop:2776 length:225 start_codon:yes stop_codon:yes gene_type:complete